MIASTILALVAACAALATLLRQHRRVASLAARVAALPTIARDGPIAGDPLARLRGAVDRVEAALGSIGQRLDARHVLSGLPTREPLLAAIADAGEGMLGAVAFTDFERLAAFDAALAERVMVVLVERLERMLAGRRLVAHVDRARLAIWYGAEVPAGVARAELDAIGYVLGGAMTEDGREILPAIGIGCALFPADAATPQGLLTRALALAASGGAAAAPDAVDPVALARDRYALEQDLRQAIARGELALVFQPLVDARARRVCGAEALLRWHHPERGLISPTRFVPVMEAAGLADRIGLWTLNAAARAAHGWQAAGFEGLRVAVNVSGHQLDHDAFSLMVGRTLARHGLGADALEVELTETVAAGDPQRAARIFDALRALGVRIAIDDFGTGFSSFSTLRQLHFDKIKIDREFVSHVDTRRDSQAICQSVIALARGLGIRVLAEGVERHEEYAWLVANGCAHFQGYYFAPPLSDADFTAFVADRAGLARLTAIGAEAQRALLSQRFVA